MTHDHRHDPNDPPHDHDHDHDRSTADDTRVVERQAYVEREHEPEYRDDRGYVPPAAGGGQVNVSSGGYAATEPGPLYYARRVVSLLFGILAVLIGLRILLLLLVANQENAIVDVIYGVTEPFVAPFRGIFQFDEVSPGGGSVFDIAAVVALIGWLLIYLLLMAILRIGDRRT